MPKYALKPALAATTIIAAFALPADAQAFRVSPHRAQCRTRACRIVHTHPHHSRPHRHHHVRKHQAPRYHLASSDRQLTGIGNVPGCLTGTDPTPTLRAYRVQVLRIVIDSNYGSQGQALPCVRAAKTAGFKVHLAMRWNNSLTPADAAAWFATTLPRYAPYLWAVSIGNEQELGNTGAMYGLTGAAYAAVWAKAEPVVARIAPKALRVAGEISPWGADLLYRAFTAGLPGVQAIGVHPYKLWASFKLADMLAWSRTVRLPLWLTEGLRAYSSWPESVKSPGIPMPGTDVPLSETAGAAVADIWHS